MHELEHIKIQLRIRMFGEHTREHRLTSFCKLQTESAFIISPLCFVCICITGASLTPKEKKILHFRSIGHMREHATRTSATANRQIRKLR